MKVHTPRARDLTIAPAHAVAIEPDPARCRALGVEAGYHVPDAPLTHRAPRRAG